MGGESQPVPVVVGVQFGITMPFGANQAMKRRGGWQLAAPARRDHRADGKKGSARLTPPPTVRATTMPLSSANDVVPL